MPGAHLFSAYAPSWVSAGQAVSISSTWSDGLGGSGSLDRPLGLGDCKHISRSATAIAANQAGTGYWVVTPMAALWRSGQTGQYPDNPLRTIRP